MANDIVKNISQLIVNDLSNSTTFGEYVIELGVFSGNTTRKDETVSIGITNAELMFIHENGSPIRNIPERPVLQMTLNWAKDNIILETLARCSDGLMKHSWTNEMIEKELNKMAIRIQKYARDIIYSNDGRLEPNKPSTIARKGDNHPLFDTGQLARSIRCKVIRIK